MKNLKYLKEVFQLQIQELLQVVGSQYVAKTAKSGRLISIDLKEMEPIGNTVQIQGDFTEEAIQNEIKKHVKDKIDVVMSDMAVNTTGIKNIDSIQTGEL